jgi:hypothetical protein
MSEHSFQRIWAGGRTQEFGAMTLQNRAAVTVVVAVLVAAGASSCVLGQTGPHPIVLNNISGPSSAVPGIAGATFFNTSPTATTGGVFDRTFVSSNGQNWILRGRIGPPATTTNDNIIITGSAASLPMVVAREGSAVPGSPLTENCGTFDSTQTINSSGAFGFACLTSNPSPDNRIAYRSAPDAGFSVIAARRNAVAPGTTGVYGNFFGATQLDDAGRLLFLNTGITTSPVSQGIYRIGPGEATATAIYQTTVGGVNATPGAQLVSPAQTWRAFTPNMIVQDRSSTSTLVVGTLNGPTTSDQVLSVDNDVFIQESQPIPGSGSTDTVTEIRGASMNGSGKWIARGTSPQRDWAVVDGLVVARAGDPIIPGSTEVWQRSGTETFQIGVLGCQGDYVLGGSTSSARRVLVLNGTRIVAATLDGADFNFNGTAEPTEPVISSFGSDELGLLQDGRGLLSASLVDAVTGFGLGQGLLSVRIYCPGDFSRDGTTTVADIFGFLNAWFAASPSADANCDGAVAVTDIFDFLEAWFAGCV